MWYAQTTPMEKWELQLLGEPMVQYRIEGCVFVVPTLAILNWDCFFSRQLVDEPVIELTEPELQDKLFLGIIFDALLCSLENGDGLTLKRERLSVDEWCKFVEMEVFVFGGRDRSPYHMPLHDFGYKAFVDTCKAIEGVEITEDIVFIYGCDGFQMTINMHAMEAKGSFSYIPPSAIKCFVEHCIVECHGYFRQDCGLYITCSESSDEWFQFELTPANVFLF
jgi:hypothetical protein